MTAAPTVAEVIITKTTSRSYYRKSRNNCNRSNYIRNNNSSIGLAALTLMEVIMAETASAAATVTEVTSEETATATTIVTKVIITGTETATT